jgi:acetyl esterase/lipase
VEAAIRFVREHGRQYGADPRFLVLCGGSAGGHLAFRHLIDFAVMKRALAEVPEELEKASPLYRVH